MRAPSAAVLLFASFACYAAQLPSAPAANDNLAKAHEALERDRTDEAIAILQQMAATQPVPPGVYRELGLAWYRTGKLADARQAFADALQQDPKDIESVQMEGLTLYRLGQPAAAIPYLERVRQWTPDAGTDANYVLGLCYLNAGRNDDARVSFAAQFEEAPDSGGAWLLLATMLNHANLPKQAVEEARKALEVSPNLPLAHLLIGEVALANSDIEGAIREFEAEKRVNPGYATVYERLGDAYYRVNRYEDAQQALTKALALDTTSTGPYILMGRVLIRKEDARTAIMYLAHAEKMDPANYITHASLAQAYRMAGRNDDAKRENDLAAESHASTQLKLGPMN